jgi:hypothetical protein
VLAQAFKSASAGTAPGTGIRINHQYTLQITSASQNFLFPSTGNLIAASVDDPNNNTTGDIISSITTSPSNTFTKVAPGSTLPQLLYVCSASTAPTLSGTVTAGAPGNSTLIHFYDISGAASSCHDVDASTTGMMTIANQDVIDAPDITPTTANGLVLGVIGFGTGPTTGVVGASFVYGNTPYTGETDSGKLNNGDAWSHVFNSSASLQAFAYHVSNGGILSAWAALAVAFKAAP